MGNNHNKYFGINKRKLILVGLPASGKTTLLRLVKGGQKSKATQYIPTEMFNNEQIVVPATGLEMDVWDLGGKLPHLWVHYFSATQGVIFMIDDLSLSFGDTSKE